MPRRVESERPSQSPKTGGRPIFKGVDINESLIPLDDRDYTIEPLPNVPLTGRLYVKPEDGTVVFRQLGEN